MSFSLPPVGSAARELMGDVSTIAEILAPENVSKLQAIWEARRAALRSFEAMPAAKRIAMVILRADSDERWLVSFGRRGGWRKEWNFGTGRPVSLPERGTSGAAGGGTPGAYIKPRDSWAVPEQFLEPED